MSIGVKSKTSYLYAIIGVSLVLFLIGTLGWIVINGRALTTAFRENIIITTAFHDNTKPEKMKQLQDMLGRQSFAKRIRFISKEEALKEENEITKDTSEALLGFNPLYASLEMNVYSEYVNKDSIKKIQQFIMQSNIVREVTYEQRNVEQMDNNFRRLNLIFGIIAIVLVIAVVILIDNTVRLAMFSNRFLIKTMQMVGATQSFITRPFDIRAVINGLISGIIAIAGLWFVILFAENRLPGLSELQNNTMLLLLMLGIVLTGIFISVISTHRSVVKYLKLHVEELY